MQDRAVDRFSSAKVALLVTASALPGAALAQSTPAEPSREQVELPTPDRQPQRPRVRIDADRAIEAAPCPLDRFDIKVTINTVAYSGVGGGPLAPEISDLLASVPPPPADAQAISVVCEIRDRATAALRRAGYVASVQIPPQTVETGTLRLEVVTARIVNVRVTGDAAPYRDTLTARVEQLKALDPLNEHDAERVLLLAGDIPGLDVQLALRPADTRPGEVIGELNVDYRPYSVLANIQNYGSRQLGREAAYVRGEVYGLTGFADVTYIGGSSTFDFEEQRIVQAGHIMGLGNQGMTLGGSFSYAWSRPDVGELDLRSESLIGAVELVAPLYRSLLRNIRLSTGLEIIEQRTRVFEDGDGTPLNRDKLRVAYLRADGDYRDPFLGGAGSEGFSISWGAEVRKGLSILDASKRREITPNGFAPSRFDGDPKAFVFRADLDTSIPIGGIFSLHAAARYQYANRPLLNLEEFSIGNLTIGRGYDPGSNSADRATAFRLEPRARIPGTERLFPATPFRAHVFGFYDRVRIKNLDPGTTETNRTLASYGAGARAILPGFAVFEAMYARPRDIALLVPNARRAPDRFLVSLTLQFPKGGR
ncbi:MAG TPA: ShlB/FhaC/HecB family hemolysin secretion/activation protein [Allosphingosinicella sp.]